MADNPVPPVGQIGWVDLTVPDADSLREFYADVTGWSATPLSMGEYSSPLSMGEYSDYCMIPPATDKPVAGVCHARGANAGIPPAWIIYIMVADLDESVRRCLARGGKIRMPERVMPGSGRYCIIEDPAGAVAGLFQAQ